MMRLSQLQNLTFLRAAFYQTFFHHGFDAEHEMFLLDHGFGFLVEINPVVIEGDTQDNIANLLSSELPDNR